MWFASIFFPVAWAAAPTVDYRHGGSIAVTVPVVSAQTQFAVVPGGPYVRSSVSMPDAVISVLTTEHYAFVAAGTELRIYDVIPDMPPRLLAQFPSRKKITALALQDGYAYLAASEGGLLIVDVRDPLHPQQIATYKPEQPLDAVHVERGRAYLATDHDLIVLDIGSPQSPRETGRFPLAHPAAAIQIQGDYAYLALPQAGLSIVDVHDASAMHEVALWRGEPRDLALGQGRVYLANGSSGMTIVDVSDPRSPRWLGSVNHIGLSLGLSLGGDHVAMRNDRSDITLIDIRDPKLPQVAALYNSRRPLQTIAFVHDQIWAGTDSGLDLVDFSAPAPNVVNIGANFGGSRRAVIRDNNLFVADWFSGLHIYDISDPRAPRHLGGYHTQGSSKGVLVRGDYAYVADDDHGVQILDISDPRQPRKIAEVATPGLAYTMKLVDDYLYLADHRGGFHIINVGDVEHPTIIGSAITAGKAWAVEIRNQRAYVAADKAGLLVFDISDPQQPRQIAAYDIGGAAEDVVIRDHFIYVASFDNGLHVFDLGDSGRLQEVGHLATPGNARGLALDGRYAYIADWVSGIQIVDISNPVQPRPVGAYDTMGWSWGVQVRDSYAYVLDWWGGVSVLDVSNPAAPTLAGAYHARGLTRDVVAQGNYAYVANGSNGLQIFDIENPLNPIWMAGVDMPGEAQSIWIEGTTALIATGADGLAAVDIGQPFQPRRLKRYAVKSDLVRAHKQWIYAAEKHHGVTIIDGASGRNKAWYKAAISDLWPATDRLLLATSGGVEVLAMDDPAHPRVLKRLAQRADLVRMHKNVIIVYDQHSGLAFYDYNTLKLLSRFNVGEEIFDLKISGNRLYASGDASGLLVFNISDVRRPRLQAAYPVASRTTQLSVLSNAVFMAGNDTLAGIRLLPDIAITAGGELTVDAAPSLPLGSYNLLALDAASGKHTMVYDAFRVVMPVSSKPRFTLQDLERAMRNRGLSPVPQQ